MDHSLFYWLSLLCEAADAAEYQVSFSLGVSWFSGDMWNLVNAHTMCQTGHSEWWMCSIFANLTDDLAAALRDAWLASMIYGRQANRLAEHSANNRTRRRPSTAL